MMLYLLTRRDLAGGSAAAGGASVLLLTGAILSSAFMALVTLMAAPAWAQTALDAPPEQILIVGRRPGPEL
jgi:hypothetical protein